MNKKRFEVQMRSEIFECFDVYAKDEIDAENVAIDEMQRRIELGHIDYSVIQHTIENMDEVDNGEPDDEEE